MIYLYDGTYEGLLSVVFEAFRLKAPATKILPEFEWTGSLFEKPLYKDTDKAQATRVHNGVVRKTSKAAATMLHRCFLSEKPNVEMLIYLFIKKAMASDLNLEKNFLDDTVLSLKKIDKMIGREVHRMHAFIRFQQTKDDIYYAVIEPDFDVMTLIISHFEKRYPAQNWIIYDAKRHYGMFYNQKKTTPITFAETDHRGLKKLSEDIMQDGETDYQNAWKVYFNSTNIPERKNMKLHLQHVPKRYWKYLTEKSPQLNWKGNQLPAGTVS